MELLLNLKGREIQSYYVDSCCLYSQGISYRLQVIILTCKMGLLQGIGEQITTWGSSSNAPQDLCKSLQNIQADNWQCGWLWICDSVARTLYKAVGILILTIQGSVYNNIRAECALCGTLRAGGKCLRKQVLKYSHRYLRGAHGELVEAGVRHGST